MTGGTTSAGTKYAPWTPPLDCALIPPSNSSIFLGAGHGAVEELFGFFFLLEKPPPPHLPVFSMAISKLSI